MRGEKEAQIRWPTGGLWEDSDITIALDVGMSRHDHPRAGFDPPCPHATNVRREPGRWSVVPPAPPDCELVTWTVPHVVVGTNEGGHATTGVCADCVVDAMRSETP